MLPSPPGIFLQTNTLRTRVEVDGGARKAQEEGVAAVGVVDVEGGVRHELLDVRHVAGHVAASLRALEQRRKTAGETAS